MRTAAASLCEPRLLKQKECTQQTLVLLDRICASISSANDRNTDEFRALKKGGILLERRGRCESRRRDALDGALVFDHGQGHTLDNEGEPQKETARANECRVGAAFAAPTRAEHALAGTAATLS